MNASFKIAVSDTPKYKPDDFAFSYLRQKQIRDGIRKLVRSGGISRSDAYIANTIIECHTTHKSGKCRPTDEEMMDSLACSKSTITRAIAALEAAGVLRRRKVGYSSEHAIEWAEVSQDGDFIALETRSSKSSNLTNSISSNVTISISSDMTNAKKGLRVCREVDESVGPVPDMSPSAVASLHSDLSDPHMSLVNGVGDSQNREGDREARAVSLGIIQAMMPPGSYVERDRIEQIAALLASEKISRSDARSMITLEARGDRHG